MRTREGITQKLLQELLQFKNHSFQEIVFPRCEVHDHIMSQKRLEGVKLSKMHPISAVATYFLIQGKVS